MKKTALLCLSAVLSLNLSAQDFLTAHYRKAVKPTKNLILMVTDGTSFSVPCAARWYKLYNDIDDGTLAIDSILCGSTRTYCSNAPIADSAPAMGCYTTGMPQVAGNIAIYPPKTDQDLLPIDSTRSYQPLATLLEGAKSQGKSTGVVATVEFPHATPAATASHGAKRHDYYMLAPQMASQNLDVCFGGGTSLVTDHMKEHFEATNTTYLADDIQAFRAFKQGKLWSLWQPRHEDYVLDADTSFRPSLAEMTDKALGLLNQNENGFFLMVEGSKVDWAAHGNDAMGCITEYIDFDEAVKRAVDFAKKDGNTTVVVTADHGNSGFTVGRYDLKGYYKASLQKLYQQMSKVKRSIYGFEAMLKPLPASQFNQVFEQYAGFSLDEEQVKQLAAARDKENDDYMKAQEGETMVGLIAKILNKHNWIGFTTGGHTGEDTFLACYNPNGEVPNGKNENYELNQYMRDILDVNLDSLTHELFVPTQELFAQPEWKGYTYKIDKTDTQFPVLNILKGKKVVYSIQAYDAVGNSVAVYMPQNGTFYLPRALKQIINN